MLPDVPDAAAAELDEAPAEADAELPAPTIDDGARSFSFPRPVALLNKIGRAHV